MKPSIGVLIYTHDRVRDAKINMEIVRSLWRRSGLFSEITIVHGYNGRKSWYPKPHLEDDLIRRPNPGHYQGAAELIDAGIARFFSKHPKVEYIVVVAADTWLVKPSYVARVIEGMRRQRKPFATCPWGLPKRNEWRDVGCAVDFFIVEAAWAKRYRFFPINYRQFANRYAEFIEYAKGANVSLEKLLRARFAQAVRRQHNINLGFRQLVEGKIYRLKDREPVHPAIDRNDFWLRTMYRPTMGLLTHHSLKEKKVILKKLQLPLRGPTVQALLRTR